MTDIPLKVVCGSENRRLSLKEGATFANLVSLLEAALGDQYDFAIGYSVAEGANINVRDDTELNAVLILYKQLSGGGAADKPLKLVVETSVKKGASDKKATPAPTKPPVSEDSSQKAPTGPTDSKSMPPSTSEKPVEKPQPVSDSKATNAPAPVDSKATPVPSSPAVNSSNSDSKAAPPSTPASNSSNSAPVGVNRVPSSTPSQPQSVSQSPPGGAPSVSAAVSVSQSPAPVDRKPSTVPGSAGGDKKPEVNRLASMDPKVIEKPAEDTLVLCLRCDNPKKDAVIRVKNLMTLGELRTSAAGFLETQLPISAYDFSVCVYGNDVRMFNTTDNKKQLWELGIAKFSTVFAFAPSHVAAVASGKPADEKELKKILEMFPTLKLDSDAVLAAYISQRNNAQKVIEHFQAVAKVKEVFKDLETSTIAEALAGDTSQRAVDRVIEKLLTQH